MPLFQPKHQKLILQCYPPGRSFDKKPNSSELSYLLYYASTRRVKLEKVGRFLEKKNDVDIHRNRSGNTQVTLEIINSLIKACPDDLNVFAQNVTTILLSVFKTNDLALLQHAGPVFQTFCKTLDGELFSGDLEFVESFTKLSESFLNLGDSHPRLNISEWKALSLKAAGSIAHCKNISQRNGDYLVKKAIPLVLAEIQQDISEDNLIKRIGSHGSEQHDLSRSNTRVAPPIKVQNDDDPPSPKEVDLDELAIEALRAYFSTSSSTQLSSSTREVSNYLISGRIELNWASALIEMIATWVPVQLRFIVLSVLTNKLENNGKPQEQLIYLHAITSLLSSSVNLVGLSAIDNLRHFISLQKYWILNSTEKDLINGYSDAIGSLANHIYYQDQIIDIVTELLIRIKETNNINLIILLIDDIIRILDIAASNKTVQRTSVPLEIFADTFSLLSNEDPLVQSKYIDLLEKELTLEYKEKPEFSTPDHNNLITNAKVSVLNEFYESFDLIKGLASYGKFINLLELLFLKFGINAFVNFIPFFYQWQLEGEPEITEPQVLHDNIAFITVFTGATVLGYDYLADAVLSRIDYRKENNSWLFKGFPTDTSHQAPEALLSKDYLSSIITEYAYQIGDYKETLLSDHYKYKPETEDEHNEIVDQSLVPGALSQNVSLTMLVQPPTFQGGDVHSISSVPLSARSLLIGKLHIPKVQELRKAVSGNGLNRRIHSTTSQKTDLGSLLNDLSLDSELDNRGTLAGKW